MIFFKPFREILNLSQTEAAELLQIQRATLGKYEAGTISPSSDFLKKYCEVLDASPNFLLFGNQPHLLSSIPNLDSELCELLNDALTLLEIDQLKDKLRQLIIDDILNRVPIDDNLILQLLDIVLIGGDAYRCRPFLFLYYMFNIIAKDPSKNEIITNYKYYIADKIRDFKFTDSINKARFTSKVKNKMIDFFDLKTSEEECRLLVEQAASVIVLLEKRMPTSVLKTHRAIFRV